MKINDVSVTTLYANGTYTYKFKLDLDIVQTENIVADNNFSKLRLEIVDNVGRVVGYKDVAFTGVNKLISGVQTIDASNIATDQFSYPFTTNIYELLTLRVGRQNAC